MDAGKVRWLLDEGKAWVKDGLIDEPTWKRIKGRYDGVETRASLAIRTFYILGGVLLAAAVFALWAYLNANNVISDSEVLAWNFFLGFGVVWGALAVIALRAGNQEMAEALFIAFLIQTAALVAPDPGPDFLFLLAPLAAAAVLAYRHRDGLLPFAALLAFEGTLAAALVRLLPDDDQWTIAWLVAATLILAGVMTWHRLDKLPWRWAGTSVAALATAIAWVTFVGEHLIQYSDFTGEMEVFVALGLGAILGVGIWLKERPLLYVGGLGLTIDAVVFAFDVGGVGWGLATLAVLAGSLIALATYIRGRQAPA